MSYKILKLVSAALLMTIASAFATAADLQIPESVAYANRMIPGEVRVKAADIKPERLPSYSDPTSGWRKDSDDYVRDSSYRAWTAETTAPKTVFQDVVTGNQNFTANVIFTNDIAAPAVVPGIAEAAQLVKERFSRCFNDPQHSHQINVETLAKIGITLGMLQAAGQIIPAPETPEVERLFSIGRQLYDSRKAVDTEDIAMSRLHHDYTEELTPLYIEHRPAYFNIRFPHNDIITALKILRHKRI